jgi:addiction module RelE/StbE family toxin
MGRQVIYAPVALNDLEEAVRYVAKDDTQAALRLGDRLANYAESLGNQPFQGSALRKRPGIRKLVCRPYLIIYRVNESRDTVEILRFWHSARDPQNLKLP